MLTSFIFHVYSVLVSFNKQKRMLASHRYLQNLVYCRAACKFLLLHFEWELSVVVVHLCQLLVGPQAKDIGIATCSDNCTGVASCRASRLSSMSLLPFSPPKTYKKIISLNTRVANEQPCTTPYFDLRHSRQMSQLTVDLTKKTSSMSSTT